MARILVVDDEASIRLFLEETLTNDGHKVVLVESGEEAVALIGRESFDLALLDLMLGGISGMEVLAAIREQAPETVVILLTAHATLETAVEALRQGAHDYLFKPCKTIQLRQSIRQGLLKRQRALQERNLLYQLEQHLADGLDSIRSTIGSAPLESSLAASTRDAPLLPVGQVANEAKEERFLQWGQLIVDLSQHIVTLDGQLLEVSPTEFDLLAYLTNEAPRVVSAQELFHEVQKYSGESWEARDVIRQHIYNIRQKMKQRTGLTDIIRTVRGVGYTVSE